MCREIGFLESNLDSFRSNLFSQNKGKTIQCLVFFTIFYFYLWLIVQPNLIYHGGGQIPNFPVFYTGWTFFVQTIDSPGGLVIYCSSFLSQLLYVSWLGAFVLTVHSFLVYQFTGYFLKKIQIGWYDVISFIPPVLLLLTYDSYTYNFTVTFAMLVWLIISCLYIKLDVKNIAISIFLFLFFAAVLYLAAAGAFWYFILVCSLYDIFFRRRLFAALFEIPATLIIVYTIGVSILKISPSDVFFDLTPFSWKFLSFSLYRKMIGPVFALTLLLPLIMIFSGIWHLFIAERARAFSDNIKRQLLSAKTIIINETVIPAKLHKKSFKPFFKAANWLYFLKFVLIFGGSAFSILCFHNSLRKALFGVDYYLANRNWTKVIEIAGPLQNNDYSLFAINRALFNLDRLSSEMFSYHQRPSCLILSEEESISSYWYNSDIFYDLGSVNICEDTLVRSMDITGQRPQILKRLALIRLAKNDVDTARVYLRALSKTLFYSGWAEDYLEKIDADPTLATDTEVQRLRSLMPVKNNTLDNYPVEDMLADLLEKNRTNKMAFEYLMAEYLFQFDLDKFVRNLPRLDDFNYQQIPRHFEEAILTYSSFEKKPPDLKGRTISRETQQRFSAFLQMAKSGITIGQMRQNFGDTYQFYYSTHSSGKSKK